MTERTLSIIKPDGVEKNLIGKIIERFEEKGLRVRALRMLHVTKRQAEGFYLVHKEMPFYGNLTDFLSEGPIVVMVLEGDGAIARVRETMGATDPTDAEPGTIRADFATEMERNVVHGSDSPESASYEIPFFFSETGIMG
jgi:nucleoside-diphosphate kinase